MTNKILLAAIALGLWANAAVSYVQPAQAQNDGFASAVAEMSSSLSGMDVSLKALVRSYQDRGNCRSR